MRRFNAFNFENSCFTPIKIHLVLEHDELQCRNQLKLETFSTCISSFTNLSDYYNITMHKALEMNISKQINK